MTFDTSQLYGEGLGRATIVLLGHAVMSQQKDVVIMNGC